MPLTPKGRKIKSAMEDEYGEEKGDRVFYASENKGTIRDVARRKRGRKSGRKKRERYTRGGKRR